MALDLHKPRFKFQLTGCITLEKSLSSSPTVKWVLKHQPVGLQGNLKETVAGEHKASLVWQDYSRCPQP